MGDVSKSLSVRFDIRGEREVIITVESDDGSDNSEIVSMQREVARFHEEIKDGRCARRVPLVNLSTKSKKILWSVFKRALWGDHLTQRDDVLNIEHVTDVERSEHFNNYYFCVRLNVLTLTVGPGFD